MKKLLATVIGLTVGAVFVHAQGTIEISARPVGAVLTNTDSFYNQSAAGATTGETYAGTAGNVQAYDYALLIASTTTAGDASPLGGDWSQAAISGSPSTFITASNYSTVAGAVEGSGGVSGVAVNSWTPGTDMDIMLVAWSSNLGSSWTTIEGELGNGTQGAAAWTANGFFGYSAVASIESGNFGTPAAGPTSIFGATGIQGFSLFAVTPSAVPEPTTLALAGLGGLSMLFLRRRKS
jgi:hypothetical protein